jgi:hypothetical protein
MKKTKSKFMLSVALPACLALATAMFAGLYGDGVSADSGVMVDPIRVTQLDGSAGRFLNVFYVSGREATLGVSGQELKVRSILRPPVRVEIPSSGEVLIPSTRVPRDGFLAFNFVLLAITDNEPNPLFLRNSDDTPVRDQRATADELQAKPDSEFHSEHTGYMSAIKLSKLPRSGGSIVIDSSRDIN